MKRRLMTIFLACWTLVAAAQTPPGGGMSYDNINVQHSDTFEYEPNTGSMKLTGKVSLELVPRSPGEAPLRIRAGAVSLTSSSTDSSKREVTMEGGLTVDHPQGVITADRGEWKGDLLTFFGNPAVVKLKDGGEFRGSPLTYDVESGAFGGKNFSAVNVPLQGMGGAGGTKESTNPHLLTNQSIKDWPAFLAKLKAQSAAATPSPGKQIVTLLPKEAQDALVNMTTNPGDRAQGQLVKLLNGVLRSPKFYSAEAWKGIALSPETTALLKKEKRTAEETIQMNRGLLQAAYPEVM